jgi:hypothetical protein
MISLELAKKLKDAGLRWEPQMGDFMYNNDIIDCLDFADMSFAAGYEDLTHQGDVGFIPRLDQLLAEIEKRGWETDLQFFNNGTGWFCEVAKTVQFRHNKPRPKLTINNKDGTKTEVEPLSTCPGWGDYGEKRMNKEFAADSPEEAAALALLWILEQEANA